MTDRRHILFAAHPPVGHTSALRAVGAELAPDAIYGTKGVPPWGPWPRALARGVTRVFLDLPKAFVNNKGTLSEQAVQTLLEPAPVDLDEAKRMFARLLSSWHSMNVVLHVPRLLEAELGESATVALAEAVLALPDESLRSPQTGRFDLCVDFGLSLRVRGDRPLPVRRGTRALYVLPARRASPPLRRCAHRVGGVFARSGRALGARPR
jgi:hypothetical protein